MSRGLSWLVGFPCLFGGRDICQGPVYKYDVGSCRAFFNGACMVWMGHGYGAWAGLGLSVRTWIGRENGTGVAAKQGMAWRGVPGYGTVCMHGWMDGRSVGRHGGRK